MAGKVSPVPFGTPGGRALGRFQAKMFNMFNDSEREAYEHLRTRAGDGSAGVVIEVLKEYVRKVRTEERDSEGSTVSFEEREDLLMFVQWWEKQPEPQKGEDGDELEQANRDWGGERSARPA